MTPEELLRALEVEAQAKRAIEAERAQKENKGAYVNAKGVAIGGAPYVRMGDASVPQGTGLAANYDGRTGEVVFVETWDTGQSGSELAEKIKCANGTDCLDDDFCYGWYECDPCEWCENNKCQPRDANRPCSATWECPCPPSDSQHYDCIDGTCLLTCITNDDCPETQVCGLTTGYCGPGCTSDIQCNPDSEERVGDAQANTFCLDYECVFPCDATRYCKSDGDCFDYEYCGDKEFRVASDPTDGSAKYECLQGCRPGSCPQGEVCNLESRSCERVCSSDADCLDDEGCDNGVCRNIGKLCITSSDCGEGSYCNGDGRCTSGCETNSDCDVQCSKDQRCIDQCGPDPSCTCEGDGCYNENWRDLCPRDPACLAGCPEDPNCVRRKGSVCVSNRCEKTCSDSSQCLEDEICKDGICMLNQSTETQPIDSRLGCECGDVCNRFGTCEVAICSSDEQCPSCSICENGVCIPGCSDENPCPNNGCCNSDGRCTKSCKIDLDCASEPGNQLCLEGGCCGLICDPLVPCVRRSDCQPGQLCAEEGYCLDGCRGDSDCDGLEGKNRCVKTYVRARNGAIAPCEYFPDEDCFSEIGICEAYCDTSADCEDGETCEDGNCTRPPNTCANDNDCTEEGDICISGECQFGCRTSSQCAEGEACVDTKCEVTCTSDEVCKALRGDAGVCQNGICITVNEGTPKEGGHKGCECYEFCDKEGYCKPYICSSDLECDEQACGSCLVGNVCGECKSDLDCPGTKVCDEGTCAYACAPVGGSVCLGSSDCPDGFFCSNGNCERGCEENSNCRPGQVCRNDECVAECTSDASCEQSEKCVEGGCRYVGARCDRETEATKALQDRIKYYNSKTEKNDFDKKAIERYNQEKEKEQERVNELQSEKQALLDEGKSEADLAVVALNGRIEFYQLRVDAVEDKINRINDKYELSEEEAAQKEVLEQELADAYNSYCSPGEVCNGDYCEPKPVQCLEDFECTYPERCIAGYCIEPPNAEDYRAFDPTVIGCESCADVCENGVCKPGRCRVSADCACGSCSGAGKCVETCRSDFDCGGGRCVGGECVECTSNSDCAAEYGPDAVCDGGTCNTPCYTGLSTGDCSFGLSYGDTCHNCPEACPLDAPCRKTQEVCDYQEVYDVLAGRTRVQITYCTVCARQCFTSSDCEPGTVCGGFGYCRQSGGRCTYDSDCAEDALANETEMICRNNTCIEKGETCFTNSDCDAGEICDGDACVTGECGSDDPCQAGKTCVDNKCVWQCGSGAEVFICGDGRNCPPGFRCSAKDTLGGYCLRDGVSISDIADPGCPQGYLCCGGGCVPRSSERQCCGDEDCSNGKKCCDGKCKVSCEQKTRDEPTTDANGFDEGEEEKQDNCAVKGKCCGEDGWCKPCKCDDKNPCAAGQCCDRETGECYKLGEHPKTKYGAPNACKYHPLYCEVLDPEGSEIDPQDLGNDRLFRGCEVVDETTLQVKCWEGKAKSEYQIQNLLRSACFEPETKECKCDEIPEQDECVVDIDCGPCARCRDRQFRNDACCGVYGEGEITSSENVPIPTGTDYVLRRVCEGDPDKEQKECGCRSSDDCTECENCVGGGPNSLGVCVPDCTNLCPCGGELSRNGTCPSCQERYGPCATEGNFDIGDDYIDPDTGEVVSAPSGCACVLDRSKKCCEGFSSIAELKYRRTKCAAQTATLSDGTVYTIQTDVCLDASTDECAQCVVDAHCPGSQVCKGNVCISQCGKGSSDPGAGGRGDEQDKGDVGGDPYNCWCCSEEGECRARYESWLESRSNPKGPWTIVYQVNGNVYTFKSSQESYQAAINDLRGSFPNNDVRIIKADGESSDGDCRPCQCTKTGIECGAWIKCESCYEWKKVGGSDLLPKAEVLRLEGKIQDIEELIEDTEEAIEEQVEKVIEAEGQLTGARNYLVQNSTVSKSQLDYQYALDKEYGDEMLANYTEITVLEDELAKLNQQIQIADANDKVDDLENLYAQRNVKLEEKQGLIDRNTELQETRSEIRLAISEIVAGSPTDAQLGLEQKQAAYDALNNGLIALRLRKRELELRRLNYINDRSYAENPRGVTYEQTRTCDCCKENTCRDESECTYGTCYFCVTEYDDTPGKAYEAALYGKVLKNKIFPGSPDRTKDTIMSGRFSWNYLLAEDTCVKYECTDGLGYEQRGGRGYNVRYYEYCTGSLLGCIFSTTKYLQGWLYEIDLSEAGTYFTNDYEHWVKLGKYDGMTNRNSKGFVESKCLYSNPAGVIGAATLVTFIDLVAGHPICNNAELVFGCPDDAPGCAPIYDTFYEAGAPDLVILRLEREKAYQEAYKKYLEDYIAYINEFYYALVLEKESIQSRIEQLGDAIQDLINILSELNATKAELEDYIKTSEVDLGSANDAISESQTAYDEAQSELDEKIEIAQEAREELKVAQTYQSVAKQNIINGRQASNTLYLQINNIKIQLKEKNIQLDKTDPLSADYVILQAEISDLENELSDRQGEHSEIIGEVLGYEEEVKQLERTINWNTCDLPDNYTDSQYRAKGTGECVGLTAKLTKAENDEQQARDTWLERWTDLRDTEFAKANIVSERQVKFKELQNVIVAVENTSNLLEDYTELAGGLVWNPKQCPEGRVYRFLQTGGFIDGQPIGKGICCTINSEGVINCSPNVYTNSGGYERECKELCDQLARIDEQLGKLEEVLTILINEKNLAQNAIKSKADEIERLKEKDENSSPPYATGPVPRPVSAKDAKELREELKENIALDEYLKKQEAWPPT